MHVHVHATEILKNSKELSGQNRFQNIRNGAAGREFCLALKNGERSPEAFKHNIVWGSVIFHTTPHRAVVWPEHI